LCKSEKVYAKDKNIVMTERFCKDCIWFIPLNIKRVIEEDFEKADKRRRICGVKWYQRKVVPIEGSECINPKEYKEPGKWN